MEKHEMLLSNPVPPVVPQGSEEHPKSLDFVLCAMGKPLNVFSRSGM
jgi:hypothetical protein